MDLPADVIAVTIIWEIPAPVIAMVVARILAHK